MTGKIFRSILAAAFCALLASTVMIMGCLYSYFGTVQTQQMWDELSLAAAGVEASGQTYLDALPAGNARLTWIAPDGTVLYDDQADEQNMENHAGREEVREAWAAGTGQSTRYSDTLLEKTVYCAQALSDGSVLRISVSTASVGMLALGMLRPACAVLAAVLLLAFFLARRLSSRIVQPLNDLDLEHPLENAAYDEIAPLLRRISQQSCQINTQLRELQQKKDEFNQIVSNMNEGLVLLDNRGLVLSINPAAQKLFHADAHSVGEDFLTIERSCEISEAMEGAVQNGHSEILLERDGKTYQADMSRIDSEGAAIGVVLLIFDITEKVGAERTRREFTANVSHELKTPLAAILGSSEMIENGMVKPEDLPRFAGHIHQEAGRLLALIEDILRLSRLDEGAEFPQETVDLAAVAADVAAQMESRAEERRVSVQVQAERCMVQGAPRLFHEIVRNLVENAIKYNVEGGSVTVCVEKDGILTVRDTGIGIPPEEQTRVFERFYRVDKSRSGATGGTGLGLSIVKHAAARLGAKIELDSTVGKGTAVRVVFPKKED